MQNPPRPAGIPQAARAMSTRRIGVRTSRLSSGSTRGREDLGRQAAPIAVAQKGARHARQRSPVAPHKRNGGLIGTPDRYTYAPLGPVICTDGLGPQASEKRASCPPERQRCARPAYSRLARPSLQSSLRKTNADEEQRPLVRESLLAPTPAGLSPANTHAMGIAGAGCREGILDTGGTGRHGGILASAHEKGPAACTAGPVNHTLDARVARPPRLTRGPREPSRNPPHPRTRRRPSGHRR